jgi:hypothetical protein
MVQNLSSSHLIFKALKNIENTIFPVVFDGCVKKEHRQRVFKNRKLRKTFVGKTQEVIGGWKTAY